MQPYTLRNVKVQIIISILTNKTWTKKKELCKAEYEALI